MNLLARYAECVFWMARYVERAENLARILEVQETFARDSTGSQNWASIVQLNADVKPFYERHATPDAESVSHFYVLDAENPNSIMSSIRAARENARTLRPLISTEMWTQLNVFYNRLREMAPAQMTQGELARVCAVIKENCQTHNGITEGTFFRDQSWYFYTLGRHLERADQITRLLDMKVMLLGAAPNPGSAVDIAQWNTVLRSAAGYHAFRRVHPRGMTAAAVVSFLLRNEQFPRSLASCIAELDHQLHELRRRFYLRGGGQALEKLDELRALLAERRVEDILASGLHGFLDNMQIMLGQITTDIAQDFFGAASEE